MRIDRLIWDEWNIAHIARHNVSPEEVRQVCRSPERLVLRSSKSKHGLERYQVFGRTEEGRYLAMILDRLKPGQFYVVTARDMSDREKKVYRRRRK